MRKVAFALLCHSGQPHNAVKNAIFAGMAAIHARGWQVNQKELIGDCMLPKARNAVTAVCLADGATDIIYIDDDNWCDPAGFLRLLDAPVDIAAAPVRSRRDPMTWNIRFLDAPIARNPVHGFVEVETVGTGIMRVTRSAIERMIAANPQHFYRDHGVPSGIAHCLFEYEIRDHKFWGEDVVFCRKWRALGGQVWVDPNITTHHHGTHDFAANFGEWLQAAPPRIDVEEARPVDNREHDRPLMTAPIVLTKPEPLTVSVCLPTRGGSESLAHAVGELLAGSVLDSTRIVVGVDDDEQVPRIPNSGKVIVAVGEREDSLGAKYNRCAGVHQADLYVGGCDDTTFPTLGWDAKLAEAARRFPDGIGMVYFGSIPGVFQPGMAVTRRLAELQGYFCCPYFPFWWHDTWADEIGTMIGRIERADVDVKALGPIGKSRGCRDIAWWARFFDETRTLRRATAELILRHPDFECPADVVQAQLMSLPGMMHAFARRNAGLRDPARAAALEEAVSIDAPADARYHRVRALAEQMLVDMGVDPQRRAVAANSPTTATHMPVMSLQPIPSKAHRPPKRKANGAARASA